MMSSRNQQLQDQTNYFLKTIKANWQGIDTLDEHLMLALRLCEQLARRVEAYPGAENGLPSARRAAAIQEMLAAPRPVIIDLLIALNDQVCQIPSGCAVFAADAGEMQ